MDTETGRLRGAWRGSTAIVQGQLVDVELDLALPRSISDFTVVAPASGEQPGVLRGVIQAVLDDGVIVLQVGTAAVQIELDGDLPGPEVVGSTVGLIADDLELYPSGV
jgi:hypothetical protein